MTQAQKLAKEKFKKAIEYRKKTGVSLKEAFAHIYGKKVGAVKKTAKKKVASTGKHIDTKSHNVNIKIVSGIKKSATKKAVKKTAKKKAPVKKAAKKRVAKITYKVDYQTGKNQTARGVSSDSKRKAKSPGKRTSTNGKTYYETRANRSDLDIKSMSGTNDSMFKDLYATRERVANTKKAILKLQGFKNDVPPSQRYPYIKKIKEFKKYLVELNVHYKELKKII